MEVLKSREFDVLVRIEDNQEKGINKEKLLSKLAIEESELEEIIEKLSSFDFIKEDEVLFKVTNRGYEYLEPHKVKRAVLLAAGKGSRMNPVTFETPKPLVSVNGQVLIESLIDALIEKGIMDITVVTGYLHHCFSSIRAKYPFIDIKYNDRFNVENNISSAMIVKDLYAGAYVMDADLLLENRDIIRRYEYSSNYIGVPVAETDDWCFKMEGGKAKAMVQGGKDTYLMVGLSYWTEEAGAKFAEDIEKLYSTEEGKQMYWDDVVLTKFNDDFDISVRTCNREDIVEIDSVAELAAIDPSYEIYLQ